MKLNCSFLLIAYMISPNFALADNVSVNSLVQNILNAKTMDEANSALDAAKTAIDTKYDKVETQIKTEYANKIEKAKESVGSNLTDNPDDTRTEEEKADDLQEKQDAYDAAREKETSTANKTLTALSTAATGIGGMELAMGLSQQKADKEADKDMDAYIETFRCTYANGKSVKASSVEIELPGGNDQNMMNYRGEYLALAADLKERKAALGMAAGIESEEILDKATTGLYDEENVGITNGSYESLYRAKALESEKDQTMIDENAKSAKNRVIAGAVVGGVGVVGGMLGNSLINGKLGELIKEKKANQTATKENESAIASLKAGLKSTGMADVDKLDFSTLDISGLKDYITNTDWTKISAKGESATELINTSNKTSFESSFQKLVTEY